MRTLACSDCHVAPPAISVSATAFTRAYVAGIQGGVLVSAGAVLSEARPGNSASRSRYGASRSTVADVESGSPVATRVFQARGATSIDHSSLDVPVCSWRSESSRDDPVYVIRPPSTVSGSRSRQA